MFKFLESRQEDKGIWTQG